MSSFLMSHSAAIHFKSTARPAAILASSASRFFCASSSAMPASCSARHTATSCSCSYLAYSPSREIFKRCCSVSRFLVLIDKAVSCPISLRFLRQPFDGFSELGQTLGVGCVLRVGKFEAGLVETREGSRFPFQPFLKGSSLTTCCTFCTHLQTPTLSSGSLILRPDYRSKQ